MTRIDERRCDVCGDRINDRFHARLKRSLTRRVKIRLYRFGITSLDGGSGWIPHRADVCEGCWNDVLEELSDRLK